MRWREPEAVYNPEEGIYAGHTSKSEGRIRAMFMSMHGSVRIVALAVLVWLLSGTGAQAGEPAAPPRVVPRRTETTAAARGAARAPGITGTPSNGVSVIPDATNTADAVKPTETVDQAMAEMKKRLPAGFVVGSAGGIFAVAGDLDQRSFERFKKGTIESAAEALWKDFFDKKPTEPIKIYLFRDAASYERQVAALTGHKPTTPYGFFMPGERTMMMNIGTGGGTLVHELTHSLTWPDWPSCPTWLLEGLGSLFEQCEFSDGGHLRGLVNWRLPVLLRGGFTPLDKLVGMTDAEFRGQASGVHYANARYLCQYLQERGLLIKFYKTFRDAHAAGTDKTGWESFKGVIGEPPDQFERKWQAWVKTLRWPARD